MRLVATGQKFGIEGIDTLTATMLMELGGVAGPWINFVFPARNVMR
jgi:hypothetical protein